jgi:clan AA aspartic protease
MGITYVEGRVIGPASVEFLVDSGARYTLLPHDVWQAIELRPDRSMSFRLADGTRVERRLSECIIAPPHERRHTPVILGEPGDDQALLGVVALEKLGLMLNPFSRSLELMTMLLV